MTKTGLSTHTDSANGWSASLETGTCKSCGWRFLVQAGKVLPTCPHCCQQALLTESAKTKESPAPYPPELIAPFSLDETALSEGISAFAKSIPFPPDDLNAESLRQRLSPLYLPMWLVDGQVCAGWEAEAGFNYEVISHQEYLDINDQWHTREVKEARIRWEPRLGRLNRVYQNIAIPAIDDAPQIEKQIGGFDASQAQPYTANCLSLGSRPVWVRLPDHDPQEAWSELSAEFQKTAAEECQQACDAHHLRQFRWKADFSQLNWTLLLLPVYTSYYQDDEGCPQPLLIHGQTGKITGARIASMRRARQTSLMLLLFGLILAALGVVLGLITRSPVAALFAAVGIITAVAALVPFNKAWDFNRQQVLERASSMTIRKK